MHERDFDFDPTDFEQADESAMVDYMEDLENDPEYEEWLDGLQDFQAGGHTTFWNDFTQVNEDDIPW